MTISKSGFGCYKFNDFDAVTLFEEQRMKEKGRMAKKLRVLFEERGE